jgi:CBS domain containing-hemolysin-like protein
MSSSLFFLLIIMGLIILANAFFATVEFALVSARRTWLQQKAAQGDSRAETALHLLANMNRVVSGTQVGVTICSLALGWAGEMSLARLLNPIIAPLEPNAAWLVHTIATALMFVVLTFFHVVLGELVPKQVALGRAERLALLIAWPMRVFLKIASLPQKMLHAASFAIARHLGATSGGASAHSYSGEELKMLVTTSYRSGALPEYQQDMIHNVIDLGEVAVREIMVPRPNIVSIPVESSLEDVVRLVTEDLHSRVPVYQDSPEHIIGVLYTKDLYRVWREQTAQLRRGRAPGTGSSRPFSLRSLLREVSVVPESKPINELLQEFQKKRRHMALVVDEFGNTVGLVTIEDVLEQIVGEIEDEYDWAQQPAARQDERLLTLDGQLSLLDLEAQYDIELPRDLGYETLAGFVLYQLGHIPAKGESFHWGPWRVTVKEVQQHRVARVELERKVEPAVTPE